MARDKLKKKIATYQEGVTIRNQEIEKAKFSLDKDEKELSKLQIEEKTLKGLVQQLKGMALWFGLCKSVYSSTIFNH